MLYFILVLLFILSVWLSIFIFKRTINPLSLYSSVWFFMLMFYELRLFQYIELNIYAWLFISFAHISLVLGIISAYLYNQLASKESQWIDTSDINKFTITSDDGKILRYSILIFSMIGLLSAIQHWTVLIEQFGSLKGVLVQLGFVYQLRVSGELEGVIPYVASLSYVGVYLAAIYSAHKSRITLISLLPFLAIVIKDIASAGRAGILLGFLEFMITYILTSIYFTKSNLRVRKRKQEFISILIVVVIFFASILIVKNLRGIQESAFGGESRQIGVLEDNIYITPSIYLYLSGHVGVLSRYLESDADADKRFGENTFRFFYNLASKFGFTDDASMYQRAYHIPIWINTGTYLRELHQDFGILGSLIFIYFIGFISLTSWQKFFLIGDTKSLVYLVHISLILIMSFLMMITRLTNWTLSAFILLIVIPLLEYIINRKSGIVQRSNE